MSFVSTSQHCQRNMICGISPTNLILSLDPPATSETTDTSLCAGYVTSIVVYFKSMQNHF